MRKNSTIAFASVLMGAVAALSVPADAACKKFGFTVNDYGKEGPTNDAKNLLDKHVAEWATKNGVSEYSTGKKTVSCELFLDVILFDEHTCTASATVCWGPDASKFNNQSAAAPAAEDSGNGAPPAPMRKAHALGEVVPNAAQAAAAVEAPAAPAADTAQVDAAPTQPVEQIAAPANVPAAAPAVQTTTVPAAAPAAPAQASGTTGEVVETGALQAGQGLPPGVAPQAQRPAVSAERAAAAAAAASAAAAAERAAQAAETAANAAKEAAAAAVAASAASRAGASVPPLDHASGAKAVHNE